MHNLYYFEREYTCGLVRFEKIKSYINYNLEKRVDYGVNFEPKILSKPYAQMSPQNSNLSFYLGFTSRF